MKADNTVRAGSSLLAFFGVAAWTFARALPFGFALALDAAAAADCAPPVRAIPLICYLLRFSSLVYSTVALSLSMR